VHIAAGVEVGGQVIVGVAPLAGAFHPDLPAPDRRAQRHQDAQLVRDYMIQWYHVARRVGLLRRTVVALQQVGVPVALQKFWSDMPLSCGDVGRCRAVRSCLSCCV